MNILEILGKIGFDWKMALANLVNFLIIFWLLKRYAFAPIKRVIGERTKAITDGLDNAKKAESELVVAEEKRDTLLAESRKEANAIVSQAHENGKEIVAHATARAEEKVQSMVAEARDQLEQDRKRMESELSSKTVSIAVAMAEKILRKKLDAGEDAKFVKGLVK